MENYANSRENIKINERGFKLVDYSKYVMSKLNNMLIPNKLKNTTIKIKTNYSDTYSVGGSKALNDNLFGSLDFHNNWLGFQGEDMIVDIDFIESTKISEINMNFLKAVNSWVFLPTTLQVAISKDGLNYEIIKTIYPDNKDRSYLVKSIPFSLKISKVDIRYLRISAISLKSCPDWHRGYGNPSWIFIDEIIVN
jgi:hexosaminidase